MLGTDPLELTGINCSDRFSAYDHLPLSCRQICWAHLERDFTRSSRPAATACWFRSCSVKPDRSPRRFCADRRDFQQGRIKTADV